ncbi:hypothetical protein AB0B30_35735 [Streptomyces narbonensis]|uniref:Uncharacterized protein n=1 Tax=Streptomyces narbonensis TaxID=67333 RepID=A0ABV3CK94_9ACTN
MAGGSRGTPHPAACRADLPELVRRQFEEHAAAARTWGARLLSEAGRHEEVQAYAATLPPEEQRYTNLTISGILERFVRGRGAEGVAGMQSLAGERETSPW